MAQGILEQQGQIAYFTEADGKKFRLIPAEQRP